MSESGTVKTLTREDLYALVWKTPMSRLAKEFGLSDVGLAKVCKRHDVPRPPVGYWAKKANGKIVRRPSLPPCRDQELAKITIDPTVQARRDGTKDNPKALASTFFDPEIGALAEREAKEQQTITVSDSLRSPHPLIKRTQEGLRIASKERSFYRDPILWPYNVGGQNCLGVHVGKEQMNRGLRIMDALVKGLEQRGYQISVPAAERHSGTIVKGLGESFQIRLREPTVRQAHVPTAEERKSMEKYSHLSFVDKYDYVPSGKLQLNLMYKCGTFTIRTFRDGKLRTIEDALADVPLAILRAIDHFRHRAVINADEARKREELERQRHEEAERKRLEEQRRKEELQRVEGLFAEADLWSRCRNLRSYLDALRNAAQKRLGFIEKDSELDRKLEWGERVADRYDPLTTLRQQSSTEEPVDTSNCSAAPAHPR
ncbi:MAG: hypothetical protein K8U03_07750 [Planctomycetia bacterium]|nr:hypothetical protein [Planctomycetia bacterium]